MPFIAIDKATGERIDITQTPDIMLTYQPGTLACQLCGGSMFPRSEHERKTPSGAVCSVRAYFRHASKECDTDYAAHPESVEHRLGKLYIATFWLPQFAWYKDAKIEYEVPIREAGIRRVVDVLATLPSGHRIAHEVQLAAITPRELKERTDDYAAAGIDVFWHLGGRANDYANCEYLDSTYGQRSTIAFIRPAGAEGLGVGRATAHR